ncbi:MAG: DUF2752 domain-containing protein [Bacteroidales bacterium]
MNRSKLYLLMICACIAGYSWLTICFFYKDHTVLSVTGGCIIKKITSVPCPSCGSTRAVLSFFEGDFLASLYWNPIGIILIAIMFMTPLWILFDVFTKKSSFYKFYQSTEFFFKRKWIVTIAVILVLANWIWNINKGL